MEVHRSELQPTIEKGFKNGYIIFNSKKSVDDYRISRGGNLGGNLVVKPLGVKLPLNLLRFHLPIIKPRRITLPICTLRN